MRKSSLSPFLMSNSTLRNNINVGPQPVAHPSLAFADLYNWTYTLVDTDIIFHVASEADYALCQEQFQLPYDRGLTKYKYHILYGTQPVRFIGLARPGESLLLATDVIVQPVEIEGLQTSSQHPVALPLK